MTIWIDDPADYCPVCGAAYWDIDICCPDCCDLPEHQGIVKPDAGP